MKIFEDISLQSVFMGLLVAFVGFASSFAVVLQGLDAVGATKDQAATALMILSVAMGLCAVVLSLYTKLPISIAWSTPGAALLAGSATVPGGFPVAVGSFLICAGLFVIAGLWKPLSKAVNLIPAPLANAMLAGILLSLCLAPIKAISSAPLYGLLIVVSWIVGGRINKFLAVPTALVTLLLIMIFGVDFSSSASTDLFDNIVPDFALVIPEFSLAGVIGISIPLFIVTMASQNVPGAAVLNAHDFKINTGPLIAITGVFSGLSALFGGHAVNLAAITAAMCASEDAHPDPARRYWSAVIGGVGYIVFGLISGLVTAFAIIAPGILIASVAGLALIGAFSNAALEAFKAPESREASAVTFLVTASGVSFFGVSGAFWGLLAGGLIHLISYLLTKRKVPQVEKTA